MCIQRNEEAKSSVQQKQGHEWESCQEKVPSSKRINRIDGGNSKQEINDSKA
jgi:hypothetical protein